MPEIINFCIGRRFKKLCKTVKPNNDCVLEGSMHTFEGSSTSVMQKPRGYQILVPASPLPSISNLNITQADHEKDIKMLHIVLVLTGLILSSPIDDVTLEPTRAADQPNLPMTEYV